MLASLDTQQQSLNLEKYNKAQKYKTKHRKQTLSMLEKTCLNH
jgi:hypothetical protein